MKDKFTITIQDVHGVKQYTLKQFFKKFFIFLVLFVLFSFIIGGGVIWYLKKEVDELEATKYELERRNELLVKKNKELQETIAKKEQELGELIAKIQNIEEMMGAPKQAKPVVLAKAPSPVEIRKKIKKKIGKIELNLHVVNYMFKHIPNGSPLGRYLRITSRYGYRYHPIYRRRKFHTGVDLGARYGQPIRATADGLVEYAGWKSGYGRTIVIQHRFGFETVFAHLSRTRVRVGQYIRKGQIIGYVGSSGRSTGPHLHYEIRYLKRPINPIYFIYWNKKNYRRIFKKVRVVRWGYLVKVISRNYRLKALKRQ